MGCGMEWSGCNGLKWNGMEGHGMNGMVCVEWNVKERIGLDWIGMEWDRVFKIDARSFQIGAPGPSKSVPEAPREIQIRFREHGE